MISAALIRWRSELHYGVHTVVPTLLGEFCCLVLVLLFALVAMISAALIRQRRYLHYGVHTVVPTLVGEFCCLVLVLLFDARCYNLSGIDKVAN